MQSEQSTQEYLYCFIRETETQLFTSKGMGDRGDPITTVHYRDLAAVVSASRSGVPGLTKAVPGKCKPMTSMSIWLEFAVP